MITERSNSATERRELRQKVRNALGPSSAPSPDALPVLRAVQHMQRLLLLATDNKYMITVNTGDKENDTYYVPSWNEIFEDVRS